jgi:trehalose 6-phosphate synthase
MFDKKATMDLSGRKLESSSEFVFLGVDRQDYAKGIIEKLSAFQFLLSQYPGLLGKVRLIQIVAPSRTDVSEYKVLGKELRNLAAAINRGYATPDWAPVEIIEECFDRMSLIRYYLLADALIVNSLADGLNLVSLEFIASRCDENGILLLSQCTGAADYLKSGSLLINPRNRQDIAMQMKRAIDMNDVERTVRMQQLRSMARRLTVRRWSASMLEPLLGTQERSGQVN